MKRVFLTGAAGFIGAAVARRLVADGHHVAALVRPESSLWRLDPVLERLHMIQGSLANQADYEPELIGFRPDTVIHLGWHGSTKGKRNDPEQVRTNVAGSVDLFMAALRAGCKDFVGIGSQAEYARCTEPLTEESPTGPATLYGAAKLATHCLLDQLAALHEVRFTWLRLFSVYGPGDRDTSLVSYVITELLRGRRPAVSQAVHRWDYLYVDDAARAITMAAAARAPGIYNVAHGSAEQLRDTILMIRDEINPQLPIGFGEADDAGSSMPLQASVTKLNALGWTPSMPLDAGLRRSIAWHASRLPAQS